MILTQVDDFLMDGEQSDIEWLDKKLDERFDCKPTEWLMIGSFAFPLSGHAWRFPTRAAFPRSSSSVAWSRALSTIAIVLVFLNTSAFA